MSQQLFEKIEQLEKKIDAVDKGLWSLRANFMKAFTLPKRLGRGRFWGLEVTDKDIQEAKKALFDFDIKEFVSKRDIAVWQKKKS